MQTLEEVLSKDEVLIPTDSNNLYHLPHYRVIESVGLEKTDNVTAIQIVHGNGVDGTLTPTEGVTNEALLNLLIIDLQKKMKELPCKETVCAITHLQEAKMWIEQRTIDRFKQGVLTTYNSTK